ncbi:pseudouridine synthase, RluA family [Amylolactobacillus amylotrophicus DSM 20534]|uniref:RNA pseudouridylate synthase n=3 Tax=Amylolactobacillus TaxID=2767876 RepID=A0A0R1YGP8_9LACO|nr:MULTISPECIES: RluA family pseudouridine synthase [Amylolactobacillus]APT18010.1 hypothetical protein LA20533_01145 [Amylolactobacillus amylophilus DSM 20533 = JCM 1125]KRK37297.1 pseudouridine synthase, RluA family [Amylolactobacillus amylotrophicus DSM 20534]KRM41696.1 pseudouridine synthase, RluA family [Amylolactobacillus amylophilus DSM 20533 = JCM 1125]GED80706.1 RNA pseudouridine synthase [Amylolactobacillus amylophilus]
MKTSYKFVTQYPKELEQKSVREVMQDFLIPKKWQHYLRINRDILVNGHYRSVNSMVNPGELLTLNFNAVESTQHEYTPSGHLPEIIYEDEDVVVINKPHGQKSHPNRLDETNTALNDVATYLAPMEQTPYVTHRLDMLTSGLLLIGKNPVVVPLLNRQLVQKTMQRFYLARVNLLPNNKANLTLNKSNYIETPIGQDISDKRKRAIKETGLSAQTTYRVLKIDAKQQTALLHLSLATGRTHQIRVHLASIGLPVCRDPLYNPLVPPTLAQSTSGIELQAYQLHFRKPLSYEFVTVTLPKQLWLK